MYSRVSYSKSCTVSTKIMASCNQDLIVGIIFVFMFICQSQPIVGEFSQTGTRLARTESARFDHLTMYLHLCIEYRTVSGVFRLLTPHPLSSQRVCPPPHQRRGVHTRRGWGGGGVNISEDARHWIGLLQYNPSTDHLFLARMPC